MLLTASLVYSIPRLVHVGSRTAIGTNSNATRFRLYPSRTRGYGARGDTVHVKGGIPTLPRWPFLGRGQQKSEMAIRPSGLDTRRQLWSPEGSFSISPLLHTAVH